MQNLKSIDKTTALFKTNPRLSGNVKFVVNGDSVYMTQLNEYNKEQNVLPYSSTLNHATNVGNFLQSYVANDKFNADGFNIADRNFIKTKSLEMFDYQYQYGARFGNKFGKHRFLAPLWITDKGCPKYFVILARRKQINQLNKKTTLFDSMKFEIIKTIDIQNGVVGKMYNNITSFANFRNEPLVFNMDNATVYGIDITKKMQTSINVSTRQIQKTEYSILEADNYLTNIFRDNKIIVQNILNLEYEFDLPDNSNLYEIAGYYVDDINNIKIDEVFDQNVYNSTNSAVIKNTFTVTKKLNENTKKFELEQFDVNEVYPKSYDVVLRRLSSPTVSLRNVVQNRFVQFEVRRAVAIGDYFSIIEDGQEYKVYCDQHRNDGAFFRYNPDIPTQMENLNDAIRRMSTKFEYLTTYNRSHGTILIECKNTKQNANTQLFCDTPDGFFPLINASTVTNTMSIKYRYEFSAFSTFRNTLVINNISTSLAGIKIDDVNYTILKIDQFEKKMFIKNILFDYPNNTLTLIFTEDFEFGDTLTTTILLSLFTTMHVEVCQLSIYDVMSFDYSQKSVSVPSKYNVHTIINQLKTDYPEVIESVKNQFPEGSDLPFISKISPTSVEYSKNPYDRLAEYDVQSLATFNKINIATNKWGSSKGKNAYNHPISANVSLSYNQANLSPVHDSNYFHDIQSMAYDYFIIGLKPADTQLYDFTNETMTMERLKESGALKKYFVHKMEKKINELSFVEEVQNYTTIFRKKGITDHCTAIFRGVEYNLPNVYEGFDFTIVHVNSTNSLTPKVSEIINKQDKSFIISIEYPITDSILTEVEKEFNLFKSDKLRMHRYVYYSNINDVNTEKDLKTNPWLTADINIDSITVGKKTQRHFGKIPVNDFKFTSGGNLYFAIDVNTSQKLTDIFSIVPLILFQRDSDGYENNFIEIVDIQDGYVWVKNITDSDGFDLLTEYANSGDFLNVNQKVNIMISKMSGVTMKSRNFITSAKRYYPIAFSRFVNLIKVSGLDTDVTKPKQAIVLNYLESATQGLSHVIKSRPDIVTYKLQRYALNATPLCVFAVKPMTPIIEQNSDSPYKMTSFENITLPRTPETISDFGIYKYGDANTLTTDDINSDDNPVHTLIGETVYDLIDYPTDFSPYVDGLRFYVHRKTFNKLPASECMVNHSGLISHLVNLGKREFTHRFFSVTEFSLNVREDMTQQLRAMFGNFSENAVRNFVEYTLSKYKYEVIFEDFEGNTIQPIVNADHLISNIYESHYTLQSPKNVVVTIRLI